MESTLVYTIALGGALFVLLLVNYRRFVTLCIHNLHLVLVKASYIRVGHQFKLLGSWHLSSVLLFTLLLCINAYVTLFNGLFKFVTIEKAIARSANLSLINLVPVIAGPSRGFLASIFGISYATFRKIHSSMAILSFLLLIFHVTAAFFNRDSFSLHISSNIWALVATLCLLALVVFSIPWFRRPYELFARMHQLLAILLPFFIWRHLSPNTSIYFFTFLSAFPTALVPQLGILIYRNTIATLKAAEATTSNSVQRARLSHATEGTATITNLKEVVQRHLNSEFNDRHTDRQIRLNHNIIQIDLKLPRPIKIKAGQHIGLCIPAVSKFSFLQVHPFMVTSWTEGYAKSLRLLVESRGGWTKRLLRHARLNPDSTPCRALFTGPYGVTVPTRNCGIALLVASGFGIVALLPYLKQLIHAYNACRALTRRIHLVWQLKTLDLAFIFEQILNEALVEDTLDDGRILRISIYVESSSADQIPFGTRATVSRGLPDLNAIFESERTGETIKRVQEEEDKREHISILVSGTKSLRDKLRKIAQVHVYDKISLFELEYQPDSAL